ncbi:ligand-effect modulator 3 family [Russula dissimulans]|nr:ligand-effect modulator 3 family [Russula dissimulans]
MPLFRRAKSSRQDSSPPEEESKKEKGSWKRPANTAFKQQRLKAWQPILTPKTVLPTLLIIGIIFAPIGALLVIGSNKVTEITIDYTNCDQLTPASSRQAAESNLTAVPHFNYRLRSSESGAQFAPPQYAFISASSNTSSPQCIVQFDIPFNITPTVLLYYKLTNFYQNHRRYVQSYDPKQLVDQIIYPCGLIANSIFNDTYTNLTNLNPPSGASSTYSFSVIISLR